MAALGRRTAQRRKIVAVAAYLPPTYTADTSAEFVEELKNMIGNLKLKYNSPYFVVAGDFNRRQVQQELGDFCDLELVETGPTRRDVALDLVFTNFAHLITSAGVTEPIANTAGVESDPERSTLTRASQEYPSTSKRSTPT